MQLRNSLFLCSLNSFLAADVKREPPGSGPPPQQQPPSGSTPGLPQHHALLSDEDLAREKLIQGAASKNMKSGTKGELASRLTMMILENVLEKVP